MALEKIHSVKKEHLCEQVYEDYIVKYARILEEYEDYSNTIEAYLPDSCYTNFRDALFHFRKFVYSSEERFRTESPLVSISYLLAYPSVFSVQAHSLASSRCSVQ